MQPDEAARRAKIARVGFALLAWAFVTTGAGFMAGTLMAGTGHDAARYLYGAWLIGLIGFGLTAVYLLRKRG
jgi:hypothetical protein